MRSLSALSTRKRQLNQLCTAAVEQQAKQNKAENNHLRKRRRYLAKQLLKRVPLQQHQSNKHWLHAVSLVFALWGFNDLVVPNQALAAADFSGGNPLIRFNVDTMAAPVFADIDGDGDLDAFVGAGNGTVKYYRNTEIDSIAPGSGFVADTVDNPLAGIDVGIYAVPTFADIDGDGDLDAFIGEWLGSVKYYRNTEIDPVAPGTGFVADAGANPLAAVYAYQAKPAFADIDGDGDLDAFVGDVNGTVKYYRNTEIDTLAPGAGFVADAAGNPLDGFDMGGYAAPTFTDIDGDGDLDAFIGAKDGTIHYYRNTEIDPAVAGTGFVVDSVANPLNGFDLGLRSVPTFADIDGDGDLDAFIGDYYGAINYFRNTEIDLVAQGSGFVSGSGNNPLTGVDVYRDAVPSFADIDGDGDLDAFVGDDYGAINYFRNTEIDTAAPGTGFVADAGANPLSGFDVGNNAVPSFADIDGDGDLDAFVGADNGTVNYYRNTEFDTEAAGTGFVADAGANPLAGFDVGYNAVPSFADIDGDGDLDAFIGVKLGTVKYYRNTEIDTLAPGTGFVADAGANPLAGFDVGLQAAPGFIDIDSDGDLDALVGARDGTIQYYRNTEIDIVVPGTGFVADVVANPLAGIDVVDHSAPTFADIDGDGDLDAFIGNAYGTVNYFQNSDLTPTPVDDTLVAITDLPVITVDVKANDQFKVDGPANLFSITAFDATSTNGGIIFNNNDNTFTYTSAAGFTGYDSFTYTLSDGKGNTAVGKVTVTVSEGVSGSADSSGGGALNPWSLLLLPLVSWLRRKIS